MDSDLNIAHMEFGEVASYLLEENTPHTETETEKNKNSHSQKKKEIENIGMKNSNKKYFQDYSATNMNMNINKNKNSNKNKNMEDGSTYLSRTFLAQHALSEIPSLDQDVKPYPEIIKTGK